MTTRPQTHASQQHHSDCASFRTERQRLDARTESQRPFDSAELERVPRPREDDPPYRPWWVIGPDSRDDAR